MNYIIENLLIGLISGLVSSIIVTQIYRKVDKKRDRYEYIDELSRYAYQIQNILFHVGTTDIDDDYIMRLSDFVSNNTLPIKNRWVKLKKHEETACNSFITFYNNVMNEILRCKMNIQSVQKGEKQFKSDIDADKLNISTVRQMQATSHWSILMELKKNYMK